MLITGSRRTIRPMEWLRGDGKINRGRQEVRLRDEIIKFWTENGLGKLGIGAVKSLR